MRMVNALLLALVAALLAGCLSAPQRPAPIDDIAARKTPVQPLTAAPAAPSSDAVAKAALALRGTPYRFGGNAPESGFDCSGLVWYVFDRHGLQLPRMAAGMAAALPAVEGTEPGVGDLVFFNTRGHPFSHVGIYVGEGRFVHAPSARTGRVIVSSMKGPYWRKRFTGVRRAPLAQAI